MAAILTQIKGELQRIIEYASRSLTDTEARYSQTEREMLAVVYACEHFNMYLYGCDFAAITDHRPLISIVSKSMSKLTAHLERLCLHLQQYEIKLRYQPGRFNTADSLSRHPLKSKKSKHESSLEKQIAHVCTAAFDDLEGLHLQKVRETTKVDETLQEIIKLVTTGGEWAKNEENQ